MTARVTYSCISPVGLLGFVSFGMSPSSFPNDGDSNQPSAIHYRYSTVSVQTTWSQLVNLLVHASERAYRQVERSRL